MLHRRRLAWILGGALFALLVVNAVLLARENPLLAVRAEVERMGHAPDDVVTLAGGYESHFLGRRAHGEFVVRENGSESLVFVEVARPTPFHDWRLVTYRKEPRSAQER